MAGERKFDHEEAQRLRDEGLGIQEIADLLGVNKSNISRATSVESVSPASGDSSIGQGTPGSFAEMRDLAVAEVWKNFQGLKGVAQIQALNVIRSMAVQEAKNGGEVEAAPPLIADVVAGVTSLAPERRLEILTVERTRLLVEMDAVDRVLAETTGG